ncbi:high-potential iron-sulfur protein [Wenzhouxiangella marina]|uniref:High-potential iron-sulfur protein n=1 Tax=Wenzhouxiangella marina TaxID=1579979 RepID=A0A0K0XWK6_9GAMM|nr:high-potential iron-sulfur protein [Wenzhouxiangella marina]AKS42084.1 High potential iron-sulfur protein (HiPIP) [Wenzhouxiangella marina]MBB6086146.1 hypothetical protein [Wenzhouxiangella marina]
MKTCSRRDLFKYLGAGSLALMLPTLSRLSSGQAWAQDNQLDPASPQAAALGYVHHFEEVDRETWTRYAPGQMCSNCQLAQGDLSADWFNCAIFPGKQVAKEGWCNAWVQRQG